MVELLVENGANVFGSSNDGIAFYKSGPPEIQSYIGQLLGCSGRQCARWVFFVGEDTHARVWRQVLRWFECIWNEGFTRWLCSMEKPCQPSLRHSERRLALQSVSQRPGPPTTGPSTGRVEADEVPLADHAALLPLDFAGCSSFRSAPAWRHALQGSKPEGCVRHLLPWRTDRPSKRSTATTRDDP